jgi:hypothetical protein
MRACIIETLLKFHQHLHQLSKVENSFDHRIDKDNSLNIFEMVANTNELAKELVH